MGKAKYLLEAKGRLKKAKKELTADTALQVLNEVIDVLLFLFERE
jgi:hypothetical protein